LTAINDLNQTPPGSAAKRAGRLRLAGVIAAAVIVAVVAYLLLSGGGDKSSTADTTANPAKPPTIKIVTPAGLVSAQASAGHPVYWAGEQPGTDLELSIYSNDPAGPRYFVRYLTGDAKAGDPRGTFLTVGTYPVPDAVSALKKVAKDNNGETHHTPDGALVVVTPSDPTSVYIAYPNSDQEIEVYDPDAARALDLALSGKIKPAGS